MLVAVQAIMQEDINWPSVAYLTQSLSLIGYLLRATMHITLDIAYNSQLYKPLRFYSFVYRSFHGFQAECMLRREAISGPISAP